jgi:hypothetical protein
VQEHPWHPNNYARIVAVLPPGVTSESASGEYRRRIILASCNAMRAQLLRDKCAWPLISWARGGDSSRSACEGDGGPEFTRGTYKDIRGSFAAPTQAHHTRGFLAFYIVIRPPFPSFFFLCETSLVLRPVDLRL